VSRYRNYSTVDDDDDVLDESVEEPKVDVSDSDNSNEDVDDSDDTDTEESDDKENTSSKKTADENQLTGMIATVWALLVIGIIVFVAGSIVKHKSNNGSTTEYKDVASGMYPISSIVTEEKSWTDFITVNKQVQSNGNTVAFYLVGDAENYGKVVYIPVSQEEFNNVNDGDKVEFVFSRFNLEGKESILIRRWNVCRE